MDGKRFDAMARSLGRGLTRRGASRLALAALSALSALGMNPPPPADVLGASRKAGRRRGRGKPGNPQRRHHTDKDRENRDSTQERDRDLTRPQVGAERKRKKKCKAPRQKCGKRCCPWGYICDRGQCSQLRRCPTCGSCETCSFDPEDGTATCLNGCPESCATASLCQSAGQEDYYRRLARHLNRQGFAPTDDPQARELREPDAPNISLLTTTYTGPDDNTAVLAYAEADGGTQSFYALVSEKGGLDRILYVDIRGVIFEQNLVSEPARAASSRRPSLKDESDLLCAEVIPHVTACDALCNAVADAGCSLIDKAWVSAKCISFGVKGPPACAALIMVVCKLGAGSTAACPNLCDALDCPKKKCNGVECADGERCVPQPGGGEKCQCASNCCKDSDCRHADLVCNKKAGVCVCKTGLLHCSDNRCRECCTNSGCTDLFGQCGFCDSATGTCKSRCPLGTTCEGTSCRACTRCETAVLQYGVPTCAPKQDCCLTTCGKCQECKGRPARCVQKACPPPKVCQASTGQCICPTTVSCPNGVFDPNACTCNSKCAALPCKTPRCTLQCYNATYGACGAAAVQRSIAANTRCEETHPCVWDCDQDLIECSRSCNENVDLEPDVSGCRRRCESAHEGCLICRKARGPCKDAVAAQLDRELCACERLYPCCSEGLICP